jgi:putative tryptophan/tyrosine transport system substrate-binding protein
MMKRRELIALLGGAAAGSSLLWPLAARPQQPAKLPTIGLLGATAPAPGWIAAFVGRLRDHGWIEGQNVAIEYRWAENRIERFPEFAAEFVQLKVDVIVTGGTPAVLALKQATAAIPIVFMSAGDPVAYGLVASLARPGGNVTGLSPMYADLVGKRLELLREVVPGLGRLAVMANVGFRDAVQEMSDVRAIANAFGLEVSPSEIRRPEDISLAFEAIKGADALYVCGDPLILGNRIRINTLALDARLPTMHGVREHVEAGGLMSYGTNFLDLFRRTADLVNKILRGTKPADIPVEQPTKFDLVVNMKTAKAIGLTIPEIFLVRADDVIE